MTNVRVRAKLLERLLKRINQTLEPLLGEATEVALLDFPNHSNVGDCAIWLGERAWLEARGIEVVYVCDVRTYSPRAVRQRLSHEGVVLVHGGGNVGDLWPRHQTLRERVLTELLDYRVVQLPQSIHFDSDAAADRARRAFQGHPDFHLLVRDQRSVEIARDVLGVPAVLCPDMAFALEALPGRGRALADVLVLARTDRESADRGVRVAGDTVEVVDWVLKPTPGSSGRAVAIRDRVWRSLRYHLSRATAIQARASYQRRLLSAYDMQANEHLLRGCHLLSRGRVVVTDRLHGHILSCLLNIPNVVVDNAYGKVMGFISAWTANFPGVERAGSLQQGVLSAYGMLRKTGPSPTFTTGT